MRYVRTKRVAVMAILVVTMGAFAVATCFAMESPKLPPGAEKYRGTKITVISAAGLMDGYVVIQKQFEKDTGIKVEFLQFPGHTLHDKLVVDLPAGSARYDVVDFDNMWMEEIRPYVEPLDTYFSDPQLAFPDYDIDDFVYGLQREFRYPHTPTGVPFGLPSLNSTMAPAYNEKILQDAGIDGAVAVDTWDGVYDAAKKVTKDIDGDGTPDIWGSPVAGALHTPMVYWGYSIYGAWGGEMFDGDWYPMWNSPNGWQSLEFFLKLAKETSPPASIGWQWGELGQLLKQGKSAFMFTWTDAWMDANDPQKSRVAGHVKFAIPPKGPVRRRCRQGEWSIGIPKTSKNKEAAFIYLQYATSKEAQIPLVKAKYLGAPTRNSTFDDPELHKIYPYYPTLRECYEEYAGHLPFLFEWWEIGLELANDIRGAWLGKLTVKEALEKSSNFAEEVLREAGYY